MNVTVVLCTYNRCHCLAHALRSVADSRVPASVAWEVLVVDNNSSDQTRDLVDQYAQRHPGRFRYVFEPQQGKSHALNTGIREAAGDVLAFMDDDVTVEPDWLQNLTAALRSYEWVGAGGRVVPKWASSPPRWLSISAPSALAPLVSFDLGSEPGPLRETPFGTNMAFRKAMFEKYGGFRADLGPRPGSQIRGEDTEFGRRLLKAGEALRYEPAAIVHHPVPPERLTKKYFLEWWFDKGRADIREYGIDPNARVFVASVPFYVLRRLVRWTFSWILSPCPARRFDRKTKVWALAGQVVECRLFGAPKDGQARRG